MKLFLLANVALQVAANSFVQMKRNYVKYFPDKFLINEVNDKVMQQHEADKRKEAEEVNKRQRQKRRRRRQRFIKNYVAKLRN